ncbi:MAG: hypothetical protein ACXV2J_05875 [Actinomycetes bacterium]
MNPLSGVLSEAWGMYRAHARHLLTIAFVVYVVAAVVQGLLSGLLGLFGALLAGIVGIIAAFLLQAALVKAVEDVRDGRVDLSLGDTLQAARPAVARVAVTSILAGIAIGIGLILLIAPGLYLLTIWCLIVPVIVLEGAGVGAAFARSRALVRGYGWQVFGTIVLVFLVALAADLVISLVLVALPSAARSIISGIVSGTLVSPFLALVLTLGYFRLLSAHSSSGGRPETFTTG